jgi:serine/threonine-protein kinase
MVLFILVVGITMFLALTPRFNNPLAPLEETLVELRSAFSNTESYMRAGSMGPSTHDLLITPDFTGLQQAEVQIEASGLEVDIAIEEENISDVAAGTVIRQDPAPGSRIRAGKTITLVVGSGESRAFLIAVENRTALDAREALNELGFVVVEVPTFDPDRPAGIVVSQSPEPGQILPKGSQVVVAVSHGIQRITIPSVVGLRESDALRIGTDLGLNVAIEQVRDASSAYQPGEVVSQQPGAGSSVELGTTIILQVYDPRPVTVPDLRGLNLEQALIALDQADLATGIVQTLPAQETQILQVIAQSPAPGSPTIRYAVVDFQLGPG